MDMCTIWLHVSVGAYFACFWWVCVCVCVFFGWLHRSCSACNYEYEYVCLCVRATAKLAKKKTNIYRECTQNPRTRWMCESISQKAIKDIIFWINRMRIILWFVVQWWRNSYNVDCISKIALLISAYARTNSSNTSITANTSYTHDQYSIAFCSIT